jgi:ribosomal protein L9
MAAFFVRDRLAVGLLAPRRLVIMSTGLTMKKNTAAAVSHSVAAQAKATVAAAKTCKAALKASATDFATKYGKGSNAFGKCVAATASTK